MSTPVFHGINITEAAAGARALSLPVMAVIGLIATSEGAGLNDEFYPLNRPVLVTDPAAALSAAGATGTLRDALLAIYSQATPQIVVVRVDDESDATIIGGAANGQRTGVAALLAAEAQTGVRPRILGAPGLDSAAVTAALVTAAQALGAMVYASCNADTVAEAITYRGGFSDRELMLITPDFKVQDGDATIPESPVARALGLRARIDAEEGWHRSLSNQAISGPVGLTQDLTWSLTSNATDVAILNAQGITAIVRRNGFRFWGCRTCSDEPMFAFEVAARTAHVLRHTVGEGLMWALGKPLTRGLITDIVETINNQFRLMVANGQLIGARAWYDPAKNSPTSLAAGRLQIDFDYTPVPPLEQLSLTQIITDSYFVDFQALGTA